MDGKNGPSEARKDRGNADRVSGLSPEALVSRYASSVRAFCLAHTENIHDAEDAAQSVLLKALAKLHTLRDVDRPWPWLLQIARTTCVDQYRRRALRRSTPQDAPEPSGETDAEMMRLHAAILKLPETCREVICLYYFENRDCPSVARTLGIAATAVRQRLVRARLMLHDLLLETES